VQPRAGLGSAQKSTGPKADAGYFPRFMKHHRPARLSLLALALVLSLTLIAVRVASSQTITNISPAVGGFALSWTPAGTGTNYVVQTRSSLQEGLWLPAPASEPWPTPLAHWTDVRPPAAAGFFRVLAVPAAERGKLLAATRTSVLTRATLQALFNFNGVPVTAQYDVASYKLVYETLTPAGGRTRASGMLMLPVGRPGGLALATYQHGTIVRTNDVPSATTGQESFPGLAFATTGYAGILPDYLGLGDSPGLHPFQNARSEATACLDLLRAARNFCATNGTSLNGQLFLCGYSQGGHATMALHRELETYHTNEFSLTASAPMAGAYDMSGVTTDDFLSGRVPPNPYYFAYVLAAYQSVYGLAPTLADLLASPYNTTLPPLFAGNSTGGQINAAMPAQPTLVLKPELLAAFQSQPNHPLRAALRDNDVYAWTPRSPLRMYHCSGDQDVVFANSQVALLSFHSRGATQVQLLEPVPGGNHNTCALPSLLSAKAWFDSLRQ